MKVKQIVKGIAAGAILMLSMSLSVITAMAQTTGFSDVPQTHANYTAIMDLKARGIIGGYADGTFKPDQVVNRVEALKIILLGATINVPDATGTGGFSDTGATEWYAKYLLKAKELKIVGGYPDGTFKPTQTVNLVENLKMLINAKGLDITLVTVAANPFADAMKDQWYAKYVEYAKEMAWLTPDNNNMIYPSQGMTRGKLAQLLYNSMHGVMEQTPAQTQQQTPQQPAANQTPVDLNVSITANGFQKSTMTIAIGTKVRWTNNDVVAHTVTSDDGKFDSGQLAPGQTFDYTFNDKAIFNYHCTNHPSMTGSITTKPAIEVPTI